MFILKVAVAAVVVVDAAAVVAALKSLLARDGCC